jgi:ATP-binding protein involved in chromosome partitioning
MAPRSAPIPVTATGAEPPAQTGDRLPGITHVVAVASGKGGVGKSTVAVNLALALADAGHKVGIVDADIHGPSIPGMLGIVVDGPPQATPDGRMVPPMAHGVLAASMGLLRSDDNPAIARGPMVTKYLQMLIGQVAWGELDYLILDLPPGTGDTQLTLAQSLQLSGAVIVTTPQDVSLRIARRGLRMFEAVQVPIIGIIENMSTFTCAHCGTEADVFGKGGGHHMADELGVPFLGAIPLDGAIVAGGDRGMPIVAEHPQSVAATTYRAVAAALDTQLNAATAQSLPSFVWDWTTGSGAPQWRQDMVRVGGSPTTAVGFAQRDARTLSVLWEDGRRDDFDVRDLRLACRCAACVEEMSGRPLLDPATIDPGVVPRSITAVGNYAVNISFSDGHATGIYAFEYLRGLTDSTGGGDVEVV